MMNCSLRMKTVANLLPSPQAQTTSYYPTKTPRFSLSPSTTIRTQIRSISSSYSTPETRQSFEKDSKPSTYNVEFKTMRGCKLGISRFPDFEYNAEGGFGIGYGSHKDESNEVISVSFDVSKLYIPPLTNATTKFLGLPLPPFLKIDIAPEIFHGSIDIISGKIDLAFEAKFWFSIGSIYKAPPLQVTTILTSEESEGQIRKGSGKRMNKNGKCQLVGVATVDPIDDIFMNSFLSLPTECLAVLNATISLQGGRDERL